VIENYIYVCCFEQRNKGTKEQRNKGTKEQRNKGTKEQRNKGTKEQRNKGTKGQGLLKLVYYLFVLLIKD